MDQRAPEKSRKPTTLTDFYVNCLIGGAATGVIIGIAGPILNLSELSKTGLVFCLSIAWGVLLAAPVLRRVRTGKK